VIEQILSTLADGCDLSADQTQEAIEAVLRGACSDVEIASLLTALRVKGETLEEIVGAARALRAHVTAIHTKREGLLDTCGTGGDGAGTFNISTATAVVVAAAGVPVAKHGNRGVSSSSGSADVLRELGVNIEAPVPVVERCLDELGIGFCYAPLLHGAMKHVAPVRRALRFRTLFNLLGPLTNPAKAEFQLLGVGRAELGERLSGALGRLGCRRALVVCGADGLDEVSLCGTTLVWEVGAELGGEVRPQRWEPSDFGLPACRVEDLQVSSPAESAQIIREVFDGRSGPARDVIAANAAAALLVTGAAAELREGVARAGEVLQARKAAELLEKLVQLSRK